MDISDRMKLYERSYDQRLVRRLPVVIRVDGKNFSKLTRKLSKPSYAFLDAMALTLKDVASSIEGCVFGYTQSDELSFVLKNDQSLESSPWFDNRIQKMASVIASEVTYAFINNTKDFVFDRKSIFDARVFVLPSIGEVVNYMIWRNQDCMKNASSMAVDYGLREKLGTKTALKLISGKNSLERVALLKEHAGIDFDKEYLPSFKFGSTVYKIQETRNDAIRNVWIADRNITPFLEDSSIIRRAYE